MEKIPSFTIDHNRLLRGVYVSRRDVTPGGDTITTFDVRMTEPNRQAALTPETLHAMEHLAATYLRNDPEWGGRLVYWGPMGCCTGNYMVVQGDLTPVDVAPVLTRAMEWMAAFEGDVPGATARDCGNYTFMDLDGARRAAATYLHEVLERLSPETTNYPE